MSIILLYDNRQRSEIVEFYIATKFIAKFSKSVQFFRYGGFRDAMIFICRPKTRHLKYNCIK